MNSNLVSKAVRYALVAGAVSAVAAPSVFAADADQTANASSTAQLGKIEVTGTRIKRTTVETAQPVTIVTAAQIKQSGFASVGDVLQSLTSTGGALNSQVNNGNDGEENLNLRNLGNQRLLVLVNGRRWVTEITNVVDFYTIPTNIIDHIEILQDGASAIYGSDAISGVVNIITIKNYNGAEANAFVGEFAGDGHHDGKKQTYDFLMGSSGDRSAVTMGVGYANEQAVWAGNRTISKEAIWGVGGGSTTMPNGRFLIFGGSACLAAKAANPSINVSPTSNTCDITQGSPGKYPGKPPLSSFINRTTTFNYAPLNYLVAPNERYNLYVQGHYDIADNLTFTSEAIYNNRSSQQSLAPTPFTGGLINGGITNGGVNIGVAAGNKYNPFGVDLVPYFPSDPNYAAWCQTYGSPTCATSPNSSIGFFIRRRFMEAQNRFSNQNVDTYHWAGGFKGYFNMFGNEWDWDTSAAYSQNFQNQILDGGLNTQRVQEALDQNCGTKADATCVPLDLFGGVGTITPAQVAYVTFEDHTIIKSRAHNYTANIAGDLFDLPAGPVGLALGMEYLENDGFFHPDALTSLGNTTGNVSTPTNGRVATDAQYFEFNIPLVTDAPFMKDVSLDIADRFSQFKWGGVGPNAQFVPGADHAHTGRAALRWQANDELLLRGSWSQGFRVPSISEFYAGTFNNFPPVTDPCATGGAAGTNATVAANCLKNGRPYNPTNNAQGNGQIQTIGGGNANLTPEKSISKTVGFVYNPDWIPGYDLSMDYYWIDVGNLVSTLGAQNIVSGCYNQGIASDCSLLQVLGKGTNKSQINAITNTNQNVGIAITDGIDLSTHYKFPSTSAGDFKLGLDVTFLKRFDQTTPNFGHPGNYVTSRLAGWTTTGNAGSYPKRRATMTFDWHMGDFSAMYSLFYIDHTIEPCQDASAPTSPSIVAAVCTFNGLNGAPYYTYDAQGNLQAYGRGGLPAGAKGDTRGTLGGQNHIGATTYSDVEGTYHMDSWNTDFSFGIQNLWDKQPPVSISAFANSYSPFYNRVPGRFFYGRIGVKF